MTLGDDLMHDREAISPFVADLRGSCHPDLSIEGWSDGESRGLLDIDAIACAFASEHSSIDTLSDQLPRAEKP